MDKMFKALVVSENNGEYIVDVKERSLESLPAGDILIKVKYSSVNYKDALSCSGNKGVTKNYPHTPGIDAAGVVVESNCEDFKEGDEVVVFGYDLGMNHSGGFSQYIRVPKNWVLKKPSSISFKEVMIYGTAGITAALCVDKLLKYGVDKNNGEILVTGATGGVGLFSIAILSKLGFDVVAVTGKTKEIEFLKDCGAKSVMSRTEVEDTTGKPLLKPRWNAAIDAVGGNILVSILKSLKYGGAVACCGLAQSPNIHMTVFPFILRGVSLLGVDSVELPIEKKDEILNKIATIYKIENLDNIYTEIGLEEIKNVVPKILKGEVVGRYIVKID